MADYLAKVERHVAQGERHSARQREIIAELDRDGHDTAQSKALVATFEISQALRVLPGHLPDP